jgi:hypothetical protein
MMPLPSGVRVWLATGYTDMRKGLRVARRMVFTSRSGGELPVTDFCLICAPRRATMSQKSSLPQLAKSVSMALIPDISGSRL